MSEKRKTSRVTYLQRGLIVLNGKRIKGRVLNISLGGLAMGCEKGVMNVGDECDYELYPAAGKKIVTVKGRGKVAYKKEDGSVGIQFVSMSEEDFTFIKRLLELNLGDAEKVSGEMRAVIGDKR